MTDSVAPLKRARMGKFIFSAVSMFLLGTQVQAASTFFANDFAGWHNATVSYKTCSFVEFPQNTIITNQYQNLGVQFTGPNWNLVLDSAGGFPQDGKGLNPNTYLELTFDEPMHSIAAHGPGGWLFQLFLGETVVGLSPWWNGGSPNGFAGFVTDISFDRVRLVSPSPGGIVFVDNVYFSTVPGPSALLTAVLMMLGRVSRSRRPRSIG